MKIITSVLLAITLFGLAAKAQPNGISTNTITAPAITLAETNAEASMPMEFTLGGGSVIVPKTGEKSFGIDVSLCIQPLKQPIWFGIAQSMSWEPTFSGSTDLYADWSWRIYKEKLYLNTGWSAGALYDKSTLGWRSGPEISLEYYTKGNAFIYVGANYDLLTKDSAGSWEACGRNSGIRVSFGIGFTL